MTQSNIVCRSVIGKSAHVKHLLVHLGVPVTVKHDDCVGGLQVQAQPSCPGGQCKDEVGRVGLVEVLQHFSPVLGKKFSWYGLRL